jgi:hypothetical protein
MSKEVDGTSLALARIKEYRLHSSNHLHNVYMSSVLADDLDLGH